MSDLLINSETSMTDDSAYIKQLEDKTLKLRTCQAMIYQHLIGLSVGDAKRVLKSVRRVIEGRSEVIHSDYLAKCLEVPHSKS